uniref:Zinc fingers and homeoboxes 3b n=1 Tax=Erpetoichthys calabaricus TaxID=27687 RepID=A0A8C4SA18_ERPCA
MASKRKSTTPCMIPIKTVNLCAELEPAIEKPSIHPDSPLDAFSPSNDRCQDPQDSAHTPGEGAEQQRAVGSTFICPPCFFETPDLNMFLDHMSCSHPDFRTEPSFTCLNCEVSSKSYEALALHNARVHSILIAGGSFSEAVTWQVLKRDGHTTIEQTLILSDGPAGGRDFEISITKTPIMKMLKGKSEPKRIIVSHSAEDPDGGSNRVKKEAIITSTTAAAAAATPVIVSVTSTAGTGVANGAVGKMIQPSAVQLMNGSNAVPVVQTAITQVVSVVQNQSVQQPPPPPPPLPSLLAPTSPNLPKVMIPLSSIPTYNAAMDTNSFLKTSFSKFPYPTKAELCYLTVVTKYPEEQIKIWFTAQRLKQGISWSPEEIEDSRRKMFNTIIQAAPQPHHPHTITVLPASLGSGSIPHILQGNLVRPGGVIVTQSVMPNGIQLTSSPVSLAVTPKPQNSNNTSSSSIIKVPGTLQPVVNVTPSTRTLPSSVLDPSFYKNKKSQEQLTALKQSFISNQFPEQDEVEQLTKITGLTTREVRKWFSDRRYHYRNLKGSRSLASLSSGGSGISMLDLADSPSSVAVSSSQPMHPGSMTLSRRGSRYQTPDFTAVRYKERDPQQIRALEASFAKNPEPSEEEVDRLRTDTKMTRREIDGWFSDRRKKAAVSMKQDQNEEGMSEEEDEEEEGPDGTALWHSKQQDGEDRQETASAVPKVNPIKINLKMLKVTESVNGKNDPQSTEPKVATRVSPRSKKTPRQLHILKQFFARTQWPTSSQYDRMCARTGLPRPEVVRWFGDSRYVYKNGQLRWLEEYQRMAAMKVKAKKVQKVLEEHLSVHKSLKEEHIGQLKEASDLTEKEIREWFAKHNVEDREAEANSEKATGEKDGKPGMDKNTVTEITVHEEPGEQNTAEIVEPRPPSADQTKLGKLRAKHRT